jgi:hypothetical protein
MSFSPGFSLYNSSPGMLNSFLNNKTPSYATNTVMPSVTYPNVIDRALDIATKTVNSDRFHNIVSGTPGKYNFNKEDVKKALYQNDMTSINNLAASANVVANDLISVTESKIDKVMNDPSSPAESNQYILKTQIVPPVFPKCSTCCNSTGPCNACNNSSCLTPGSALSPSAYNSPSSFSPALSSPALSSPGIMSQPSGTSVALTSPGGSQFAQNTFNAAGSVYNSTLATTTNTLGSGINTVGNTIGSSVNKIGDTIGSSVKTGEKTITSGLGTATNTLGSGINTVGNTLGSGVSKIGETAQSIENNAASLIASAGSGTKNTLSSVGSTTSGVLSSVGGNVKDLLVSGVSGITGGIKNLSSYGSKTNISSQTPSIQGPPLINNGYVTSQVTNQTAKLPSTGINVLASTSPSPLMIQNNTPYNLAPNPSAPSSFNAQPKRMALEKTYPISDYYTNLVSISSSNSNNNSLPPKPSSSVSSFSPSAPSASSASSFSPSINQSTPSSMTPSDVKLLLSPGATTKNLNNSWIPQTATPSSDYMPLPPDLGPFEKFIK